MLLCDDEKKEATHRKVNIGCQPKKTMRHPVRKEHGHENVQHRIPSASHLRMDESRAKEVCLTPVCKMRKYLSCPLSLSLFKVSPAWPCS